MGFYYEDAYIDILIGEDPIPKRKFVATMRPAPKRVDLRPRTTFKPIIGKNQPYTRRKFA